MPTSPGSEQYANNARSTLAVAVSALAGSITVDDSTRFPIYAPFRIMIESEILLVTSRSGATFTVERGAEGTTAASHAAAANVTHLLTKFGLQNFIENNAIANVRLGFNPAAALAPESSGNTIYAIPYNGNKISLYDSTDDIWR